MQPDIPPTPQPESQPQAEVITPPAPEEPPKKKPRFVPIIIAFVLFLFIGSSAVAGYFAYQKIYLSPERVIGKMFSNYSDVKSFSYKAKVNLSSGNTSNMFDFDLIAEGKTDLLDESMPENYGKYEAYVNKLKVAELEYSSLSKDIYLKLNYLLSFGYKIDNLKNVWVNINTVELSKQFLGEVPEVLEPEEEKIKSLNEELGLLLQEKPPFKIVEDLGSDEVDGHNTWHYKLEIDKDNFLEYLQKISEASNSLYTNSLFMTGSTSSYQVESYKNMLEEVDFKNVQLWIDKKEYFPRKVSLSLTSNRANEDITMTLEIVMDNYNKDQAISVPSDFLTTEQFVSELEQVFTNPQKDTNEFSDLRNSLFGDVTSEQNVKTRDAGRMATLTQLGHVLEAYATVNYKDIISTKGYTELRAETWITDLVAAGELNAVPDPIVNTTCDGIGENGICFITTGTGVDANAVIYTDVEAAANKNRCATGSDSGCIASVTDPIFAYSTANGRAGLVCATSVTASEFAFCDQ